jgi:hypothetical protein
LQRAQRIVSVETVATLPKSLVPSNSLVFLFVVRREARNGDPSPATVIAAPMIAASSAVIMVRSPQYQGARG